MFIFNPRDAVPARY